MNAKGFGMCTEKDVIIVNKCCHVFSESKSANTGRLF